MLSRYQKMLFFRRGVSFGLRAILLKRLVIANEETIRKCTSLMKLDTLIRDNDRQLLRWKYDSEKVSIHQRGLTKLAVAQIHLGSRVYQPRPQ